jgi:hypothetical protein
MIEKIYFIKSFNIIKGEVYTYILMKAIKLQKELFVLDIEQGNEVWIPKPLSLEDYPKSF